LDQMGSRTEQMKKSFLPLALVVGISFVDTTKGDSMFYIRAYFIVGQMFLAALYFSLLSIVSGRDDKRMVEVGPARKDEWKVTKRPKGEKVKQTVTEYDTAQCWMRLRSLLFSVVVSSLVHLHWGPVAPLIVSVTISLAVLSDDKLVQVYLRGFQESEHADLERPWKSKGWFGGLEELRDKSKQLRKEEDRDARKQRSQLSGAPIQEQLNPEELARREKKKAKRMAGKQK